MTVLNVHEVDTSRAYRIIESRLKTLEARGYIVATGEVTCATSAGSTDVTDAAVLSTDTVALTPVSANAIGSDGPAYVSAVTDGQFTISHANAATTDRTFRWWAIRPPA